MRASSVEDRPRPTSPDHNQVAEILDRVAELLELQDANPFRIQSYRRAAELGATSLEELERAAHDGRLVAVGGIGAKKAEGIRHALAGMLGRSARRRAGQRVAGVAVPEPPSVALLLDLDAEYLRKALAGQLRRVAPKRSNPGDERWLPIMDAERDGWGFTVLFSNTQRAHDLHKTRDWVVIYYHRDHDEGQCTVVTGQQGPLKGRRVVRGRERECREHYAHPKHEREGETG